MIPFNVIGTKEGDYENASPGERFGPYTYPLDDFTVKLFAFAQDDYNPWCFFGRKPVREAYRACGMLQQRSAARVFYAL